MVLFFKQIPGRSPASQLLRTLGVAVVFVIVGVLFWKYWDESFDRLSRRDTAMDQTGRLSPDQLDYVASFARHLEREFGFTFKLRVTQNELQLPDVNSKTLFIGIAPSQNETQIVMPPLMRRGLDAAFVHYLESEHFELYWENDAWPQGLEHALTLIWDRLSNME